MPSGEMLLPGRLNVERAIFVKSASSVPALKRDYARVYYGEEFCERLIPSVEQVCEVLDQAKAAGLGLSLVTPYVTEDGLKKLDDIFRSLEDKLKYCEIVVSDWGVFRLARKLELKVCIGRLLSRQTRDPRISGVSDGLSGVNVNSSFAAFLNLRGVERIEIDNPSQGIRIGAAVAMRLKISVHYPFAVVTTTRFCPTALSGYENGVRRVTTCRLECKEFAFKFTGSRILRPLILKGNSLFYFNDLLAVLPEAVDRIVYRPDL